MDHRLRNWWKQVKPRWWTGPDPVPEPKVEPKAAAPARQPMKIQAAALEHVKARIIEIKNAIKRNKMPDGAMSYSDPWKPREYPPGVLPNGRTTLAMDDASGFGQQGAAMQWAGRSFHGMFQEGIGFMGYPYLAELTQRTEYRRPSEIIAEEMTRKWIEIITTGKEDKSEKITKLTAAMKEFKVREVFRDALELEGYMGLSFIYIDVGMEDNDDEQMKPLLVNSAKIQKGQLQGFKKLDPTWTAPYEYNTSDPLNKTYYLPQSWYVMSRRIHSTRLLTIISRPVPDILKPAYNFGGISLSQMLKPYVDNWLETRQGVSDLIQAFTVFVLETNLSGFLGGGGGNTELDRMDFFTQLRTNLGLMVVDKDTEALTNVSAPLGTLDHLQAQSQEHMAAVTGLTLVKSFGLTPSGLNATAEPEIRVLYDMIHARQERVLEDHVIKVLQILQLNEFGEIDPEIGFKFVDLWELDEAGAAAIRKIDADTDAVLIENGVISPAESRTRIAKDPDSPYAGLEGDPPEPPEQPEEGGGGSDPSNRIANRSIEGEETEASSGV